MMLIRCLKLQLWNDYFSDVLGRHVMCLFYCLCILLNVGPFIILFNFRKCFTFSVRYVLILSFLILLTASLLTASSLWLLTHFLTHGKQELVWMSKKGISLHHLLHNVYLRVVQMFQQLQAYKSVVRTICHVRMSLDLEPHWHREFHTMLATLRSWLLG